MEEVKIGSHWGNIKQQSNELALRQSEYSLETSAFLIFRGGNSTFINSFDKTKFLLLLFNDMKVGGPVFYLSNRKLFPYLHSLI